MKLMSAVARRAGAVLLAAVALPPLPASGTVQDQDAAPLFASTAPLSLTLTADFTRLEADRGDDPPERQATVTLTLPDGEEVRLDAQLRTRGNFRRARASCHLPPLRLNLKKGQVGGTVFAGQDKLKVVGNCRPGRDSYGRLVLREYLAYRLLQAVTDEALRVRLARIRYEDTSGGMEPWTELAFFIEDADALAARLGGSVFELEEDENLPPGVFEARSATRLALFQYLIGNTDWSETKGHNVEIVETARGAVAVPYDFDFSGLVDAPYASPDPEIGIRSVRERRYLGWCRPPGMAEAVVAEFRAAREASAAMIRAFEPMDEGERRSILDYLEPFYDAIETDRRAELTFLGLCRRLPGR